MTENFTDFLSRKHFRLLDGIRAIAILAVVWHHSGGLDPFENTFFGRGYLGVDLFFVLSGFLITTLLLREKAQFGYISLRKFYLRRTLRIFPIYYAYLFAVAVWYWLANKEDLPYYLSYLPVYLLYLTNWIQPDVHHFFERGWSLAVEEQFYLIWPATLLFFGLRTSTSIIGILISCSVVISVFFMAPLVTDIQNIFIPFRTILLGCLLAISLNTPTGFQILNKVFGHTYAIILVVGLILIILFTFSGAIIEIHQFSIHMLFTALIACTVLNENNALHSVLGNKYLQKIGVVSYGIYIVHSQFYGIAQKMCEKIPFELIADSRITFFIFFTTISFSVALFSFYYFEIHFLKLKQKFIHTSNNDQQ